MSNEILTPVITCRKNTIIVGFNIKILRITCISFLMPHYLSFNEVKILCYRPRLDINGGSNDLYLLAGQLGTQVEDVSDCDLVIFQIEHPASI